MSFIYINENGARLSIEQNRIVITYKDGMRRLLPIESVEGIYLLGKSQITTQCMESCLKHGIPMAFFSKGGAYFGRLMSTGHIKAGLQRKQASLYDSLFSVELCRSIIEAKIHNQLIVLRRYARTRGTNISNEEFQIQNSQKSIANASEISQIMGYEGIAAKHYFQGLNKCINEHFHFSGRSRRPPLDPFNSLLSLGYSVLMNCLYAEIENHGMNPYFGFMHRDAEKHPTLASDMMEEWRAVLIDAVAMSLINGNEIEKSEFNYDEETNGCFIERNGLSIFLKKLENKMQSSNKYLSYIDHPVNFRRAIGMQVSKLAEAIEENDSSIYIPVKIR